MATYKEKEEDAARAILLGWHRWWDGDWVRLSDETDDTPGPMQWECMPGWRYLWAPSAKIVVWYETEWKPATLAGRVTVKIG